MTVPITRHTTRLSAVRFSFPLSFDIINPSHISHQYFTHTETIGVWIESELVSRFGLIRREIPDDSDDSDVYDTDNVRSTENEPRAKSRIYMRYDYALRTIAPTFRFISLITPVLSSSDTLTSPAPLLLLIQGSGVVRPGQWARSVIINDSLNLGSMFPYIQRAQELGWNIIIFNPNENEVEIKEEDGAGPFDFDQGEGDARRRVKVRTLTLGGEKGSAMFEECAS